MPPLCTLMAFALGFCTLLSPSSDPLTKDVRLRATALYRVLEEERYAEVYDAFTASRLRVTFTAREYEREMIGRFRTVKVLSAPVAAVMLGPKALGLRAVTFTLLWVERTDGSRTVLVQQMHWHKEDGSLSSEEWRVTDIQDIGLDELAGARNTPAFLSASP